MKSFEELSPLGKTITWCVVVEVLIVALAFWLTKSLAASLLLAFGLLGPASVWVGPLILQHYKAKDELKLKKA
ncbi:hypothetical protein [Pseudoduganella sp.]|uniref:hypothetical protein n=1 Tax=Pseudoduganella sp. TaxID=1880898 RepID=UPI0035AFB67F